MPVHDEVLVKKWEHVMTFFKRQVKIELKRFPLFCLSFLLFGVKTFNWGIDGDRWYKLIFNDLFDHNNRNYMANRGSAKLLLLKGNTLLLECRVMPGGSVS